MRSLKQHAYGSVAAVLISLLYIHASEVTGRLAHDVSYDDIAYLNDAIDRLIVLVDQGIWAFFDTFLHNPPHSPLSTVFALTALSIGGYSTLIVYATNSLLLVAVVSFLLYAFRNFDQRVLIWIGAAFLTSPIAYNTIENFRPDFAVGFVTTAMAWWFITGMVNGDRSSLVLAGGAFGGALLVKPSFFAHTLALAIGLSALYLIVFVLGRKIKKNTVHLGIRPLCVFWGIAFILALPYYVIAGRGIFDYFWNNTRGADAYLWSYGKEVSEARVIRDYLGSAYQRAIGFHLILCVVFIVVGATLLTIRRNWRELAVLGCLVGFGITSFTILVIGRHKNSFFFSTFQVTVLIAGFYGFGALYSLLGKRSRNALIVVAWCALVAAAQINLSKHAHFEPTTEDLADHSLNRKIVNQIQDALSDSGKGSNRSPVSVIVTVPGPVNAHSMKWIAAQGGLSIRPIDRDRSSQMSDFLEAARATDFVVVPNALRAEFYRQFPGAPLQSELLDMLRKNSDFVEISPKDDKAHYHVFKNVALMGSGAPVLDFHGVKSVSGFANPEGPYPQWQLPRVQWMSATASQLCVQDPGVYDASMRFRANSAGYLAVSDTRGHSDVVGHFTPDVFTDVTFTHTFTEGDMCVTLTPTVEHATVDSSNWLLFSRFRFAKSEGNVQ
ncbi:ArnT family glycosyltransferase [Pararobbsia alpina]|uniref:Uncharacterized protein n=1 Tax=Pararobbsia alpina TaxID=621374 RepID=A0A6S7AXK4_9BURK|nr:glycosyltransferase family 39 protein [Pararobbsia alpina]CAB3780898.1 hypothetical protein LMG28138_01139 [Pararobbsia alpina]